MKAKLGPRRMSNNLSVSNNMNIAQRLMRYKVWADIKTYQFMDTLPLEEIIKSRETYFGSILHTLHHVYIVEDIFNAHLENRSHGYEARKTDTPPSFTDLWESVQNMNDRWIEMVDQLNDLSLNEVVQFKFLNGEDGNMTRLEMVTHIVNHASYHRGYVDILVEQIPAEAPASDFPVFLKEMSI